MQKTTYSPLQTIDKIYKIDFVSDFALECYLYTQSYVGLMLKIQLQINHSTNAMKWRCFAIIASVISNRFVKNQIRFVKKTLR